MEKQDHTEFLLLKFKTIFNFGKAAQYWERKMRGKNSRKSFLHEKTEIFTGESR